MARRLRKATELLAERIGVRGRHWHTALAFGKGLLVVLGIGFVLWLAWMWGKG